MSFPSQRMCIVCREMRLKGELYRLVRCPGGSTLRLDESGKAKGRGYYICRGGNCLRRLLDERRYRKKYLSRIEDKTRQRLAESAGPQGG